MQKYGWFSPPEFITTGDPYVKRGTHSCAPQRLAIHWPTFAAVMRCESGHAHEGRAIHVPTRQEGQYAHEGGRLLQAAPPLRGVPICPGMPARIRTARGLALSALTRAHAFTQGENYITLTQFKNKERARLAKEQVCSIPRVMCAVRWFARACMRVVSAGCQGRRAVQTATTWQAQVPVSRSV